MTEFKREVDCIYKNEHYSVRDNGAVLRHERKGKSVRKLDNQWTFGKYFMLNSLNFDIDSTGSFFTSTSYNVKF